MLRRDTGSFSIILWPLATLSLMGVMVSNFVVSIHIYLYIKLLIIIIIHLFFEGGQIHFPGGFDSR